MNTIFVKNCLLVQEPATALMDWAVFTQFKKGYFARLEASYNGDAHSPAFLHMNNECLGRSCTPHQSMYVVWIMMIMVVNHDDDELDW